MRKRTKIVCTLGPATNTVEIIHDLVNAGMNIARLNFSHGTHEEHARLIRAIREVEKITQEPIAIIQDLQGPKIRVGVLPEAGVTFSDGELVEFDTSNTEYENNIIPIDYKELHRFVKKNESLFINDGKIATKIILVQGTRIKVKVLVGGHIVSHQGINVPNSALKVLALTEKDKADLAFGVEQEVDIVALSFVAKAQDILAARLLIKNYERKIRKKEKQPIAVIAKIERAEAVKNIKEILAAADGIMIARGDLGVEMPAAEVPLLQKRFISLALISAKPVIVATQMLDSMQTNPHATRAEVSDVANAVIDHTDAVMLSNETATGKYPLEAVTAMSAIIRETEASAYDDLPLTAKEIGKKKINKKVEDTMSELARALAEHVDAKLILVASLTGETGRFISRYRPELPIFVGTSSLRTKRQLNLSWGVLPFALSLGHSIEELVARSLKFLRQERQIRAGDKVVIVAGESIGVSARVNLLEVREIF